MNHTRDHTGEVEKRVKAIPIKATDTCAFYEKCTNALIPMRECWYCRFGQFERDTVNPHQDGFCKFKK